MLAKKRDQFSNRQRVGTGTEVQADQQIVHVNPVVVRTSYVEQHVPAIAADLERGDGTPENQNSVAEVTRVVFFGIGRQTEAVRQECDLFGQGARQRFG